MTQIHPITPPDELVKEWSSLNWREGCRIAFAAAARWGADQELDACCEWVEVTGGARHELELRTARRPKPPSLKKQALSALYAITSGADDTKEFYQDVKTIKHALESLPD